MHLDDLIKYLPFIIDVCEKFSCLSDDSLSASYINLHALKDGEDEKSFHDASICDRLHYQI